MSNLRLEINHFKAIAAADIRLDGITVLSGVNSSGKSTLSRILYYGIQSILDFEVNQYEELLNYRISLLNSLIRLAGDFHVELLPEQEEMQSDLRKVNTEEENKDLFFRSLESLKNRFGQREKKQPFSNQEFQRIRTVVASRSRNQELNHLEKTDVRHLFEWITDCALLTEQDTIDTIKQRPLSHFDNLLARSLKSKAVPVSLYEDGLPVIDREHDRLNNLYSVERVFYSDTPMSITAPRNFPVMNTNTAHWDQLRQVITDSQPVLLTGSQQQVNDEIAAIISGTVSQERTEFNRRFNYKRTTDGLTIDLAESATGIKSFAILQLLLNEGLLDDKSLLILDEPEAHLHPQWIVEYARIVVLLNKKLGVKFMIATHNPDMVSALRYIAEKEGLISQGNTEVRFYLAEKEKGTEQYRYKDLGTDIEPVFLSFNIALDRIDQYGV